LLFDRRRWVAGEVEKREILSRAQRFAAAAPMRSADLDGSGSAVLPFKLEA